MHFLLPFIFSCTRYEDAPRPSLVLITVDTTRRDAIGAYGKQNAGTPHIDAIAQNGIRFDQAYTTVPLTTPAHASILTGLYPSKHGIRNNGDALLSDDAVTLAEVLQENQYDTAAAVSAFVTTRIWNLHQGFDDYFDQISSDQQRWSQERSAESVVDDLVGWLSEPRENPFFIWAHFYDPHHPHIAPEPYISQYPTAYEAEIAYMDAQIGRLKKAAEASTEGGVAYIVIADHGESFGEHGENGHGLYLWNTTMHIPFVMQGPEPLTKPVEIQQYSVSGVDVFASALGILDIPNPHKTDGRDLSGLLRGKSVADVPVYLESVLAQQRFGYHPEIASVYQSWKLIDTPSPQLLHLTEDPDEGNNLFTGAHPQIPTLRTFSQSVWNASGLSVEEQKSSDIQEQLALLGYMSNDFSTRSDIDIKDRLATVQQIEDLRKRRPLEENPAVLIPLYKQLIEEEPQLSEVRMGLAALYTKLQRHEEALVIYEEALELEPNSNMIKMNMANTLGRLQRFVEGIAILEDALEKVPTDTSLQSSLLKMLIDTQQLEVALQRGSQWYDKNPNNDIQALIGIALFRSRKPKQSKPLLAATLADRIPREYVMDTLAKIARLEGNVEAATYYLEQEYLQFPKTLHLPKLAQLYSQQEDWDNAAEYYSLFFAEKPKSLLHRLAYAQVLFNIAQYEKAEMVLQPLIAKEPKADVLLLQANILAKTNRMKEGQRLFQEAQIKRKAEQKPD